MTSWQPYWCSKTVKRRPCLWTKPILWKFNSFFHSNKFAGLLDTWVNTLYWEVRENDWKTFLKSLLKSAEFTGLEEITLTDWNPKSTPHFFRSFWFHDIFYGFHSAPCVLSPRESSRVSSSAPLVMFPARSNVFSERLVVSSLVFPRAVLRSVTYSWLTLHTSFLLAFRDWVCVWGYSL